VGISWDRSRVTPQGSPRGEAMLAHVMGTGQTSCSDGFTSILLGIYGEVNGRMYIKGYWCPLNIGHHTTINSTLNQYFPKPQFRSIHNQPSLNGLPTSIRVYKTVTSISTSVSTNINAIKSNHSNTTTNHESEFSTRSRTRGSQHHLQPLSTHTQPKPHKQETQWAADHLE
jgi:hypothetical protein